MVWLYWIPFNPYISVPNTLWAFKKHKEILKSQAYCYIANHLGMHIGFCIFFLRKRWKPCKALYQCKTLLFLLFHEIPQSICTCQGLRIFLQSRNNHRCYSIIACFFAYRSRRLASFLKCDSYITAKNLYKKWNLFSLPDVLVTWHQTMEWLTNWTSRLYLNFGHCISQI